MSAGVQGAGQGVGAVGLAEIRARSPEWAHRVILAGYRGSESHGTSVFEGETATDDVDVFAVSVQSPEWYMGLPGFSNATRQVHETAGDYVDLLIYDVRKFFSLLAKGNPNVHVFLWLRPEHYLWNTFAGARLIMHRRIFLSTACLDALCGYATSQFARMERGVYHGYMGEKRKALADRFGYDVKNAAHCIRLLHMGIELCTDGTLHSWRPAEERAELIAIKRGEWSLEDAKARAAVLWAKYREIEPDSGLPKRPDHDAIDRLLVETIIEAHRPACEDNDATTPASALHVERADGAE